MELRACGSEVTETGYWCSPNGIDSPSVPFAIIWSL
jgi:hypothetical protein